MVQRLWAPVIRPFWDMSIAENLEAFTNGANVHQLPNIFLQNSFYNGFIWIGGAGTTLSLVVFNDVFLNQRI